VNNIGKPDAGKLHVRFDEGWQGETCSLLYRHLPVQSALPRRVRDAMAVVKQAEAK